MHLQLNRAGGRLRSSDRSQRRAHLEGRARRSRGVIVTFVEQQQGVAAELEQTAALRIGDGEQGGEGRVHDLRDFLRPGSAETGELLGHRGEARDVDEGERAVDLAPHGLGIVAEPLERQPWDERDELGARGVAGGLRLGHLASFCASSPPLRAARVAERRLHGRLTPAQRNPPEKGTSDTS